MSDQIHTARPLTVLRARGLGGRFKVPSERGLFCLAAMLAVLARGETVLYREANATDGNLEATRKLLVAIGAEPEFSDDRWQVNGLGPLGLLEPERRLDFTGATRALPLAMGLVAPYGFTTRFIGERSDTAAPNRVVEALRSIGTEIETRGGRFPISVRGPRSAIPFAWPLAGEPAGKAALLLAALSVPGVSTLIESEPAPDHPERLFRHFGAAIGESESDSGPRTIEIAGLPALGARTLTLAGDPDIAALAVVAGLIVPESDILVENVMLHPAHRAVFSALEEMGGQIDIRNRRSAAGEEVADFRVRHSPLLGIAVPPDGLTSAALIVLAVAGAFAAGDTRLPRLGYAGEAVLQRRLAEGLANNGAAVSLGKTGLVVARPSAGGRLGGGTVSTGGDPLLTAAFMVFGLAAMEQVAIDDDTRMEAAYPGLTRQLETLGAEFLQGWAA
ncbi:MAG: 3-phosphoshikimate 1-carboxyvinyltransferase [Devosia sp.]